MPNLLDKLYWYETHQVGSRPSSPEQLVDVEDSDVVLEFTYRYLEAHSLPPSDDEVHNVTATIARYKGPRIVRWAILESFLAGLLTVQCAWVGAGTAIELRATIMEVQCNAEQRTKVRACAKPQEMLGTGSYKSIEVVGRRDSDRAIRVDPTRQVVVRTLLY